MHHGAHDAIRTLARAALEADRLDDAERLVERSLAVSTGVRPPYEVLSLVDRAKVWWARGETDAAYETLDRARTLVAPDVRPSPLLDYVSVTEARWRAEQGDVVRARELALALDDGRERETVGIRCHLAAREFDQARAALDVLVKDERTPRNELVDALLAARVDIGRGDDPGQALEHVLAIGRAHGFVRTLIDEGTDFTDALARELRRRPGDDYTDALVRAIDATARRVPVARVVLPGNVTLSERETTVLRLLATRMTMREIAGELFVSLNTLKTHCKSIYRKLGADSRRSAVEAARTFGVLSPAPG
jgi:LuxR family maltose regulon positive regulatory protein